MLVNLVANQITPAGQSVIYWCRHLQHSLLPILKNRPCGCDLHHRTDKYARTYQFCATIRWYGGHWRQVSAGSIYVPNYPKNADTDIENCKIWLHSSRDDLVRIGDKSQSLGNIETLRWANISLHLDFALVEVSWGTSYNRLALEWANSEQSTQMWEVRCGHRCC